MARGNYYQRAYQKDAYKKYAKRKARNKLGVRPPARGAGVTYKKIGAVKPSSPRGRAKVGNTRRRRTTRRPRSTMQQIAGGMSGVFGGFGGAARSAALQSRTRKKRVQGRRGRGSVSVGRRR